MLIGFIGGGKMAEALIKGMGTQGNKNIVVSEILEERRQYLGTTYGIKTTQSNQEIASTCAVIILAVKPQNMATVLDEVADSITEDKIVVSIAAGITLEYLQKKLKTKKIVRVIPNTPALVQEGMTALSFNEFFSAQDTTTILELFTSVGKVLTIPESSMNAISALSGSGPAFIALFLETLIEAGVKMGLPHEHATLAAHQTLIGTATLLKTGMSLEHVRQMVTSPGGTTAEGLRFFEKKELKEIVAGALYASLKKAEELGCK